MGERPWNKLRPIHGFTRIPDAHDGTRRCRCNKCGHIIPTLGVGYHTQSGFRSNSAGISVRPCTERFPNGWKETP
jgi:hypothetical protein